MDFKYLTLILNCLLVFSLTCTHGQELIFNEVQSSNTQFLDEDQDSPDWFELLNKGLDTINLEGYFISDKSNNPTKWKFPKTNLSPDDYLVVFASDKDRDYILQWRSLVVEGDEFSYLLPNQSVDESWTSLSFSDDTWQKGNSGFGYGDGDDATEIPAGISSIYIRKKFTLENIESIQSLLLHIDYDDAFVAYINGAPIARANIDGYPPSYNQFSITDHEAVLYNGEIPEEFSIDYLSDFLIEGENVLAIQGHNVSPNSSDFSLIPFLTAGFSESNQSGTEAEDLFGLDNSRLHTNFKISSSGETIYLFDRDTLLVDSLVVPELLTDVSYGLNPITNSYEYYEEPTPSEINNTASFQAQSLGNILFNHESGLVDQIALTMSTEGDKTIRYTLDSSIPNESSEVYSQPISILSNTIVEQGFLKKILFHPKHKQSHS